jgi:predicted cobalt transporter CbtA
MNRNVVLLALSQALAMTVVSLMLSASALVSVEPVRHAGLGHPAAGRAVPGDHAGAASAGPPDGPPGRRPVFVGGALVGAAGLALAWRASLRGSFAVFVLAGCASGCWARPGSSTALRRPRPCRRRSAARRSR